MSPRWAPAEERFAAKVDRRRDDECWPWLGAKTARGYGCFSTGGRQGMAHRFAYEQAHGAIPVGLTIDHLCGNRACVNPAHLEAVTMAENVRRWARGITHCPRGHEYTSENTRLTRKTGRQCRTCHRDRERARRASHVLLDPRELPDDTMQELIAR